MYSIKQYRKDFKNGSTKQWCRYKKALKKVAHTKLRRGATKNRFKGREIAL